MLHSQCIAPLHFPCARLCFAVFQRTLHLFVLLGCCLLFRSSRLRGSCVCHLCELSLQRATNQGQQLAILEQQQRGIVETVRAQLAAPQPPVQSVGERQPHLQLCRVGCVRVSSACVRFTSCTHRASSACSTSIGHTRSPNKATTLPSTSPHGGGVACASSAAGGGGKRRAGGGRSARVEASAASSVAGSAAAWAGLVAEGGSGSSQARPTWRSRLSRASAGRLVERAVMMRVLSGRRRRRPRGELIRIVEKLQLGLRSDSVSRRMQLRPRALQPNRRRSHAAATSRRAADWTTRARRTAAPCP